MKAWRLALLSSFAILSACGGQSHTPGGGDGDGDVDGDADGDADPGCPEDMPQCAEEDCERFPEGFGCPCGADGVEIIPCYQGPEGSAGVGPCEAGLKRCEGGAWGFCEGQVLPGVESCNEYDDDCDGVDDDGVQSACGNCNPDCTQVCVGVGCPDGFADDGGRNVVRDPDGSLTMGDAGLPQNFVIWIANSTEGTVSKIDTRTREEVGRYRTAWGDFPNPSRTSVNPAGDVVVSNRGHGSSTRILASDCPDRDGDGVVETSTGTNDVLAWSAQGDWEDECIVWNVDGIPAARGTAVEIRAGLDGGIVEYVWVASYPFADGPIYEIDMDGGEKTGRELAQMGGYGLAMGPEGVLWSVGLGACPVATDTTTLEQTDYSCPPNGGGAYGVAVDGEGRVWIGNSTARLDPFTESWEVPLGASYGGGITVDAYGNAYTGELGTGVKIDGETMEVTPLPGMGGHGWAVDFDGFVWAIDMIDSAHVMDPETFEVVDVTPPFVGPYTYSDMTGFMLVNTIAPQGLYEHVMQVEGCEGELLLESIGYEATLPAGTFLRLRLRSAESEEELAAEEWLAAGLAPDDPSPIEFEPPLAIGATIAIEVIFETIDRTHKPSLASFTLQTSCGP